MDIIIRNVSTTAMKKIDEMKKKISRQKFLKGQLENMLEKVLQMIGQYSSTMENMNELMHELMGGNEQL